MPSIGRMPLVSQTSGTGPRGTNAIAAVYRPHGWLVGAKNVHPAKKLWRYATTSVVVAAVGRELPVADTVRRGPNDSRRHVVPNFEPLCPTR